MYTTTAFRKNLKIELNGEPFVIVDCQHVKPGKGVAFVKTRLKNLITGASHDVNFRSGDKVDKPDLQERDMSFLYHDGVDYVFMDSSNYEQINIQEEQLGDRIKWITENLEVTVLFYKNRPIDIELPNFVQLVVVETDPGVKGDTASGGSKPAKLETGTVVNVPLYLNQDELIKVDTRTGEYVERVKK